jgi:hypothetical protein
MEKKARKRASLGNALFISVQEGRDRVQQFNAQLNKQVKESISRPRQRAPPRCSGCWTVRHTIRNCPNK